MTASTSANSQLPDDCFLAYSLMHEAWYADVVKLGKPTIMVGAASNGGGCAWEFVVTEHILGSQTGIRLEMFDDSFDAFAQIPDFFTRLRTGKPSTLREVQALLDSMGAVDSTERQRRT